MRSTDFARRAAPFWAPEGDGGGGGGDDTVPGGAGGPPPSGKWYEDKGFDDDQRAFLTTKGLAVDDQGEAIRKMIQIGRDADKRFGKPLDSVIDRPAKDQPLADWRRANAEVFGIPADEAGYTIERPKELHESIAWNEKAETSLRQVALARGWGQEDVQAATALYASVVTDMTAAAEAEGKAANERLLAEIGQDWGKDADARMTRARQAVQVLAEKAGLSEEGRTGLVNMIALKAGGDARAVRLFDAIGEMLADDALLGRADGGSMSAEEAKAQLKALRQPGGAFYEAKTAAEREKLMPEIERLSRIATAGRAA